MATAADHYEHLLAEHYTWMLGGNIEATATEQTELLRGLGLGSGGGAAIDLGCGPGPQTLALADLGYHPVTAVDTSAALLDELREHIHDSELARIVRPVRADLRAVVPRLADPGSVAAVVCMGDTLTHLPTRDDVRQLVTDVADALRPGGDLVLTYRDLTQELHGTDRFILLRSATDRILTCFLDYTDPDTVQVHDLLHTRTGGAWQLKTSSYPKLRLSPEWLADLCRAALLDVRHNQTAARGLRVLHAVKP